MTSFDAYGGCLCLRCLVSPRHSEIAYAQIVAATTANCPQCGAGERQNASKPKHSYCGFTVWANCGACGSRWSEEYTLTRVKMSPKDDVGL